MAKKGSFSKVYDKNGDYADVEAVRFDGTRTVQMQGDVTASQTWNGDPSSPLTLNVSIGAKKVTQDKIADKAVGTGQMGDGSVGLTQMDPNAMTSSATSGDTRLITAGGVRTEIDNAILNRGKDYGPMTPTQINAISETIPTGSTVHVTAAGTITDGDIEVRQGEDLKYYRSGNTHYWYSMDGEFKLKQQAKTSPTASGNALSFIDSITQDENGEISATKKSVQDGTTSQKGVVQLEDSISSTSTTKAATPNSVKSAYDLANTANTGLANKLDKTGDGKDVTVSFSEASTRANIGTGEKLSVMFGKIKKWFTDLKALAFKDTVSDSDISGTISDNHIASASTWNGKADKVSGATNGNLAALDSNGNLTDSGKKASDFELVTNKVTSWQTTPDDSHFPSEKLVKDSLDGKQDKPSSATEDNIATFNGTKSTKDSGKSFLPSTSTWDGTSDAKVPTAKAVQRAIDAQKLFYRPGNPVYGYAKLGTVYIPSTNKGAFKIQVTACYVVGGSVAQIDATFSINAGTITTGAYAKGLLRYKLAYKANSESTDGHLIYDIWLIDTTSGDSATRRASYVLLPTDIENWVNGNQSTQTLPDGLTYFTTLNDVSANGAVGSTSIPTYVGSDGEVKPCTDTFVNNIAYVANQSGGGGNLNKTINGTTTSVLAFMNDSEAVAIWADAKTAAANAS